MELVKLHVSIDKAVYDTLTAEAMRRGIIIQELIRAVVLPDWLSHIKPVEVTAT
jgi:hypothetical protein